MPLSYVSLLLALFALLPSVSVHAEDAPPRRANSLAGQQMSMSAARPNSAWQLQTTDNFCICCSTAVDSASIGRACESLREQLSRQWLGDDARQQPWISRCYVVVHPTMASYLCEVGLAGSRTLGSSITRTEHGQVVSRRIDLRGDITDPLKATLPHELTHVILADAFAGEELPRWADEGVAMLADPAEKLAGHARDLQTAISDQKLFHVAELFATGEYPAADGRTVFYAESSSVVRYLVSRKSSADFLRFVHLALRSGYNDALHQVYAIDNMGQLERLWRSDSARMTR